MLLGAPRFWVPRAFGCLALLGAPRFWGPRVFVGHALLGAYRFLGPIALWKGSAEQKITQSASAGSPKSAGPAAYAAFAMGLIRHYEIKITQPRGPTNHVGGQNNVNKIIMEGDQVSNIEESREFISITECQITTAVQAFTMAQIINCFIEAVAGDKEKTNDFKSLRESTYQMFKEGHVQKIELNVAMKQLL